MISMGITSKIFMGLSFIFGITFLVLVIMITSGTYTRALHDIATYSLGGMVFSIMLSSLTP